jgi:anthranilate synthase
MHGKPSIITNSQQGIFEGFPKTFKAGRYHSLYIETGGLPSCLERIAVSDDNVVMGVAHTDLPVVAVQFHPESILTLQDDLGLKLITNVVRLLCCNRSEVQGSEVQGSPQTRLPSVEQI